MFAGIPQSRLIIYLMVLALSPFLFLGFRHLSHHSGLESLDQRLLSVEQLALTKESQQHVNTAVRDQFRQADHYFIDKQLENLTFLEPEIESLQQVVTNKNFAGDEEVKRRLDFLTGPTNKLLFTGGDVLNYPFFQESVISLTHPVEVNIDDLKKLLTLIEGVEIAPYHPAPHRPQLIILDLKLDQKQNVNANEVFLLNLTLLKREFQ